MKKTLVLLVALVAASLSLPARVPAQAAPAAEPLVLFLNVRVFDGSKLSPPTNVLVRGNKIEKISQEPIKTDLRADNIVIEGNGRTLMPGLIDAHWHAMMASLPMMALMTADIGYINLAAAKTAQGTLMNGFTSVRDASGPAFGLKMAIDQGLTDGPRIWPSGAQISQTSGHGDMRFPYEIPTPTNAPLSRSEIGLVGIVADGADAVLKRSREQLMLGATQLKLAAGGGVSSSFDPIDVTQYTEAEFRAAVDAAENWGTYVTVHAYTPNAIQRAIRAGVKCIEHGQLMDDATAKLMAEKGVWLSVQAFVDNEFSNPQTGEARVKQLQMYAGTDKSFEYAKKHKVKVAWGTDVLFSASNASRQGAILATMTRWYTPVEVLRMATATNAELLAMSGPRNPYPGKLGVVEEGALADLLLVGGDPIANIQLIADPGKNFHVIMKNGKIYKNLSSQ